MEPPLSLLIVDTGGVMTEEEGTREEEGGKVEEEAWGGGGEGFARFAKKAAELATPAADAEAFNEDPDAPRMREGRGY